jgi:transposase
MSDTPRNEPGVARRTHRVYSLELKQQIVQETLQPGVSVSVIARKHDINDNLVFEWRRLHRLGKLGLPAPMALPSTQCAELLPVKVIDSPRGLPAEQVMPRENTAAEAHGVTPPGCEVEIEVGKRRVRIRGLSMDRAEQFLRDCLR